ncbi:phospholipase [Devosia sp. YIM 151766]|uniref:alpha/beta hydrolase n=1 Tax=Devosia sp. YIM 151766 TaxID=3017325 RepID=UPI00255CB426|nr:phospholipase [Devosia sp. YIM 151766]WIY52034.1 phospholipase [Devosia sp. YIM 151766]
MSMQAGMRLGASGSGVRALCVLVHGRGQSPEEMERHILRRLDISDVAFALPRAPGGVWYDARAVDPLTDGTRSQLDEALKALHAEITALQGEYPGLPLLLAGFSQGACLSIEYVCRGHAAPDALAALTGCRVGTPSCERPDAAAANLPAYLSGSDADPWIPLAAMAEAALALGGRGLRLRADIFPGRQHEVSDAEIGMLAGMLSDLAAGQDPGLAAAR